MTECKYDKLLFKLNRKSNEYEKAISYVYRGDCKTVEKIKFTNHDYEYDISFNFNFTFDESNGITNKNTNIYVGHMINKKTKIITEYNDLPPEHKIIIKIYCERINKLDKVININDKTRKDLSAEDIKLIKQYYDYFYNGVTRKSFNNLLGEELWMIKKWCERINQYNDKIKLITANI